VRAELREVRTAVEEGRAGDALRLLEQLQGTVEDLLPDSIFDAVFGSCAAQNDWSGALKVSSHALLELVALSTVLIMSWLFGRYCNFVLRGAGPPRQRRIMSGWRRALIPIITSRLWRSIKLC
jgi:hypothetical protein